MANQSGKYVRVGDAAPVRTSSMRALQHLLDLVGEAERVGPDDRLVGRLDPRQRAAGDDLLDSA